MNTEILTLITSTSESRIHAILEQVVDQFERAFPQRVAGYYVTGSWSSGAALFDPSGTGYSSDIDLHVIFRNKLSPEEQGRVGQVIGDCQRTSLVPLEVHTAGAEELCGYWDVALKQCGLLVYGTDIRDEITLPSVEDHLQRAMTYPPYAMAEVRGQEVFTKEPRITYPLAYPDPDDRFFGYAASSSTGPLVSIATWAATITLAAQAQCIVGTKRDAVEKYQQLIGDEWSPLIRDIFTLCKLQWHNRIPEDPAGQERLRGLCGRMLSLENHLLEIYKPYLVQWLGQEEADREFAAWILRMVQYPDLPVPDATTAGVR